MRTTLVTLLLCACGTGTKLTSTEPPGKTPPPNDTGSPLTSTCSFDATAAPRGVLVAQTSKAVFMMRSDGSRATLFQSQNDNTWLSAPQVRGRFVAVFSSELVDNQYASHIDIFDADGVKLASADNAATGYLSERGHFAMYADTGITLLSADGTVQTLSGLAMAGDFGPGAALPVWTKERTLALLDADTLEVTPLAIQPLAASAVKWSDDTLVYLAGTADMPVLVRQQGAKTLTTTFTAPQTQTFGLGIESLEGSTAILESGSWQKFRFRLDVGTGVVTPLEVAPPQGSYFAGSPTPALADDGSFVAPFTKDGATALFGSSDGKSWQALSGSVTGATWMGFAGKKGTWLVAAGGSLQSSAPTTFAVIPAMGLTQKLPSWAGGSPLSALALSDDGRCAAVWSKSNGGVTLSATDLMAGTLHPLAQLKDASTAGAVIWLQH